MMENKQGMDDFLQDVEDVQCQINKIMNGDFNEKEFNELERRVNRKKYEEQERIKKEQQKKKEEELRQIQKVQGISGKGQGDNYKHFCEYCSLEFEVDSPECFRCKRKTLSSQQRKQFLKLKVEEYKQKKLKREERKKRWELWQKTKAIYTKKNITDYEKWNLFTDSENSDEEYQKNNPILPKNDPAFKAMEIDLQKRNNERNQRRQVAEKLKQQGNKKFSKKNFLEAIDVYTEGLKADKQNKALWLNRALAYIKIKRYDEAIKDCSEMIEYMDVLEDGFVKSTKFAVKAFLRRSMAYFEKKQFKESLQDALKAKEIFGKDDNEIDQHIKKIEQFYKVKNDMQNIDNLNDLQKKLQEQFLDQNLNDIDWKSIQNKVLQDKDYQSNFLINDQYFLHIKNNLDKKFVLQLYEQDNILKQNVFHFLYNIIDNNVLFIDVIIKTGLAYVIIKLITQIMEKEQKVQQINILFAIEQTLDILLLISQQQKGRYYLIDRYQFIIQLTQKFLELIEKGDKKIIFLLDKSLKVSGNLMYDENSNKEITKFKIDFNFNLKNKILQNVFILLKENKNKTINLISSIFSMFTNLLNNQQIRKEFIQDVFYLKEKQIYFVNYFNQMDKKDYDALQNFTNFFINLSYKNPNFSNLLSNDLKQFFSQKLIHSFKDKQMSQCQKILIILAKSNLENKELMIVNTFVKKNLLQQFIQQNKHNHCILLLNQSFSKLSKDYNKKFFKDFKKFLNDFYEFIEKQKDNINVISCLNNTIVFLSNLIENIEELNISFKKFASPLIYILKEKTGVLRKQSAIMLAKMSKNNENLKHIRSLHGTEIILNLKNYLIDKQLF